MGYQVSLLTRKGFFRVAILLVFVFLAVSRVSSAQGLGSSPPRCNRKCGRCTPCRPVRVTVPPGASVSAEYYPEAWRCKCGNKMYGPVM